MNKDININTNQKDYPYKLTPFKLAVLQNFPYIESDFDALTDYGLLCKVVEYLNNVIANQNVVQDNVTALNNAFTELKNYIDTYFGDELTEKVDDKLNEFAENGTLEQMIAKYISNRFARTYNSVADMKTDIGLIAGMYVNTLGYHIINDGGSASYFIRNKLDSDTIDSGSIIELSNNNVAVLIDRDINVKKFGAYGNGIDDDSDYIQNAINYLRNKVINNDINMINVLEFTNGNYRINKQIILSPLVKIKSIGMCVFTSYVANGSTFWLCPQSNDINDGNLSNVRDWYQGLYIDGSAGFVINSMVDGNNIGLEIGLHEKLDNNKGFMLGKIFGLSIHGFKSQLKINPINVYCDTFEKLTLSTDIRSEKISIQIGDSNLTKELNSGERITFKDCQLGSIDFYSPLDINFLNCSFDFVNYVFKSINTGYSRILCDTCWFEGISYLTTDNDITNNNSYGIISQPFIYSTFTIINSKFVMTNLRKLFSVSTNSSINYLLILNNIDVINNLDNSSAILSDPANAYFCSENVNVHASNVYNYNGKKGNNISKRLNLFANPNFNNLENGSITLSTGSSISTYNLIGFTGFNTNAMISNNSINNEKSLELTSTGDVGAIRLMSEKINVNPGDTIQANAWFKGFDSFNIKFYYYDYNNNLISSSDNYINNIAHDTYNYFLNPFNKIETVPSRCKSIQIEYRFNLSNPIKNNSSEICELIALKV